MGQEINLLDLYPRSKRPIEERGKLVTEEHRKVARQFGKEYFDGDRLYGYGGYKYHPRFWQATVKRFRDYYCLAEDASVLDVGCAKGFMLHDFKELMPKLTIAGIDISEYAIEHAIETVRKPHRRQRLSVRKAHRRQSPNPLYPPLFQRGQGGFQNKGGNRLTVKPFLRVGNAKELPYPDNSFDLVISINTVHNLALEECKQALREIQRVSSAHAFITVDAWRTDEERERMMKWNLTALTYMHVDDWKKLFAEVGYTGDYYWFIAE